MVSSGFLTDLTGVAVGHWTDTDARTGCTVVVVPDGTVGSAQVRGGAPASRELELLDPVRTVAAVDAVVLTGGSAFGLAAADGVMAGLAEAGRGVTTPAGLVPIVPTLALFDLAVGDPAVRPGPLAGRAALGAALDALAPGDDHDDFAVVGRGDGIGTGGVGAGTGCTVDKWRGLDRARPSGLVAAAEQVGGATVLSIVAVNAFGSVGVTSEERSSIEEPPIELGTNTTIGVVLTDARLDKVGCHLLAGAAHDGLARAVFPAHTRFDGDAFIALATGGGAACDEAAADPGPDLLCQAACSVVERAILALAAD